MGDLQWNLLNTNAPAQVAQAWDLGGAYQKGQAAALDEQIKRAQLNKLQMEMEYSPMKLYAQQQAMANKNALSAANTQKVQAEIGLKEMDLGMRYSGLAANAPPGQVLNTALRGVEEMGLILRKTPAEIEAMKQETTAKYGNLPEEQVRQILQANGMKIKEAMDVQAKNQQLGQSAERVQQGWVNAELRAESNQTAKGNLAVNQQNAATNQMRANQPNIQFINTGAEQVPINKKAPLTQQPTLTNTLKPGQAETIAIAKQNADTNQQRAEQAVTLKEIGANRPHVAKLVANGWIPTQRMTKPMLDTIEAAAAEAEMQGLPFDPDDLRAYEFQAQKNTALGRTAGSRLVEARAQNITAAKKLLGRMQETAKELDFSDIKIAAIAEKWVKGQTQDPVLTRYMTQRADALFALGNALKQNGITDKAIQVEEEAAHPTVSPKAFDAWYKVQLQALEDSEVEMQKSYNPKMPNRQQMESALPKTIGRFQIEVE